MENIKISIILASLFLSFISCCPVEKRKETNVNNTVMSSTEITLEGSLTEAEAISFGRTYNYQVKKVLCGNLTEKTIRIVVLAGDENECLFQTQDAIEITFKKNEENVPYQLMPITGFVDQNMTAWKVKKISTKEDRMTLDVTATEGLQVGYGTLFNCNIIKAEGNNLKQDSILLMLIKFELVDYFRTHALNSNTCKLTVKKTKENIHEKYLPIDGFVDDNNNVWEIISIK